MKNILIISTPEDTPRYAQLLGDGSNWGINIQYAVQPTPGGLAQAFLIGKEFIGTDHSALILGDNIFHGNELSSRLSNADGRPTGATIFSYHVHDPERYGVVEFDVNMKALSIQEKPEHPKSSYAVTGLYFYDNQVCDVAKSIIPSPRGELEITDVNNFYLSNSQLHVESLNRGFTWLDTGTHDSLLEASSFIATVQKRQGQLIGCPEEVAYSHGWISAQHLHKLGEVLEKNSYGKYLLDLSERVSNDL